MNKLDLLLEPGSEVLCELQRLASREEPGWDVIAKKALASRPDVRDLLWDKLITDYGSDERYTFKRSLNHRLMVLTDWTLTSKYKGGRVRIYARRSNV